jgi:azurin
VARLLPLQFRGDLAAARERLMILAQEGEPREVRPAAWAGLAIADDGFDAIWGLSVGSKEALTDLMEGIPMLLDPGFRARAYDRVLPLLEGVASEGARALAAGDDTEARLRRAAIRAAVSMNHEPVVVFQALARLVARGESVVTAAQGMRVLPRSIWPRETAGETSLALALWAETVPATERTSLEYVETVQFAGDLAGFLPADRAAQVRSRLRELRVPVFVVRTVREQMRFDTPRLVVEAGKAFELIFENVDFMPHNLVVVRPGTRDRVGTVAASMRPEDLDAEGRAFVPRLDSVLAATRMLGNGERETLRLTAPLEEGDYEYVCTFPGHHQVMWGWLIVTRDVEGYLERNPEAQPSGSGVAGGNVYEHGH